MTQSLTSEQLQEHFREDIPCMTCGKSAALKSMGHGPCITHKGHRPPLFKCVKCYTLWLKLIMSDIIRYGCVVCMDCDIRFRTVEEFSDYRPF